MNPSFAKLRFLWCLLGGFSGSTLGAIALEPAAAADTELSPLEAPSRETQPGRADSPAEGVILQVFNWPFARVTERMAEFAALGYTHIHVSPPSLSINRSEWWARYQPLDYRIIAGPLGSEREFARMNDLAETYGIRVIADVVLNHMANPDFARYNMRYTDNPEDLFYPDPMSRAVYGLNFLFTPEDFSPSGCIKDYNNRQQVLNDRLCLGFPDKGLPDLNLARPNVFAAHRAYLDKLMALGVDGFRVDALKHIPPSYIQEIFRNIDRSQILLFGEIIAHPGNMNQEIGPYAAETDLSFYDFPLVFLMRDAFQPGGRLSTLVDPAGRGQALPGNRAVTFIVNHDIPNNGDIFKYLLFYDTAEELLAYTYILGRAEGLAYVYTDLGQADGLDSNRFVDAYNHPSLAAMIQFRKAMQGLDQHILWASDQVLVWRRGDQGLVVVNKSGTEGFDLRQLGLQGLQDGKFRDALSGSTLHVTAGRSVLAGPAQVIAPRSSALFQRVGR